MEQLIADLKQDGHGSSYLESTLNEFKTLIEECRISKEKNNDPFRLVSSRTYREADQHYYMLFGFLHGMGYSGLVNYETISDCTDELIEAFNF